MGKVEGCYYCDQDEEFQKLLFKICDLEGSEVFLCKDQTLPGRCTICAKDHYEELYLLPKASRDIFMDDVCALAETIQELFGADKINYAIYGDACRHTHFTICPKYKEKLGWGKPFILFPDPEDRVYLTDQEYKERIELIKKTVLSKRGL